MSVLIQLSRTDAIIVANLLEIRAHDLRLFIEDHDYEAKHGVLLGSAVKSGDQRYLSELLAIQDTVNNAIKGE